MRKRKFKIGDKVRLKSAYIQARNTNDIGTVVCYDEHGFYGVKFNCRFRGGHSLGGKCEELMGYFIPEDYLESFGSITVEGFIEDRAELSNELRKFCEGVSCNTCNLKRYAQTLGITHCAGLVRFAEIESDTYSIEYLNKVLSGVKEYCKNINTLEF